MVLLCLFKSILLAIYTIGATTKQTYNKKKK